MCAAYRWKDSGRVAGNLHFWLKLSDWLESRVHLDLQRNTATRSDSVTTRFQLRPVLAPGIWRVPLKSLRTGLINRAL